MSSPQIDRFLRTLSHRSRSTSSHSVPVAAAADLADALAGLSACREPAGLLAQACRAFGELLGLDAVAAVRASSAGVVCDARWARHGARPGRVGEARVAAGLELAAESGGAIAQRLFGRLQLIAIPVPGEHDGSRVVVATANGARRLSDADHARAASVASHLAACLEMLAAIGAAREYMTLERSLDPVADTSRGDRALDQIRLVQALCGALTGLRSLPEVGQVVVSRLRSLVDHHACSFYVVSPDGHVLTAVAQVGTEAEEGVAVAVGEGVVGRSFADGRIVQIDDAGDGAGPAAAFLVAPMVTESGPLGVIALTRAGAGRFDDDDVRLLEVVAGLAAMACDNVRLFAEQREAAEVSEALLQVGGALPCSSAEAIAAMLAAAIYRLVECAGTSVWHREGELLVPAACTGYTPREQRRVMAARLRADAEPLARRSARAGSTSSTSTSNRCWPGASTRRLPAPRSRSWRSASAPPTAGRSSSSAARAAARSRAARRACCSASPTRRCWR